MLPTLKRTTALILVLASALANAAPTADLWPFWDVSNELDTAAVDHTLWQAFLDDYVSASDDGINRVDYRRAAADGGRERLQQYLAALAAVDPRTLRRAEQLAYWINLYNALTIEVVLNHLDKPTILRMGKGWLSSGPWGDELITLAGQELTLDDIEHRILRPIWNDRRIHFAVNCASLGCPNLQPTAFRGDNTERLLSEGEQQYINHPRGVSLTDDGTLQLSSIFDWYQVDFAADEKELLTYLGRHHDTLSNVLDSYDGRIDYEYDWSLNSQTPR